MSCKLVSEEFLSGRVCDGHQTLHSADDNFHRHPTDETTNDESKAESKAESINQTEAPAQSTTEAAAAPAVTETEKKAEEPKETVPQPETAAPVTEAKKDDSTVQDAVDKVEASKAGQVSSLDNGEAQANSKSYHQVN